MKYRFTDEVKTIEGNSCKQITLHRIQATTTFRTIVGVVKAGDLGGWIEKEENLSQCVNSDSPSAWVAEEAQVYGKASVSENAAVFGEAKVEQGRIEGYAKVYEKAHLIGVSDVVIKDNAAIFGRASILDDAKVEISGTAKFYGAAQINCRGVVKISGNARVHGFTFIQSSVTISGNANIKGVVWIENDGVVISDNAFIDGGDFGGFALPEKALILGNAHITESSSHSGPDMLVIGPFGDEDYLSFFHDEEEGTLYVAGHRKDENCRYGHKVWEVESLLKDGKIDTDDRPFYDCVKPEALKAAITLAKIQLGSHRCVAL